MSCENCRDIERIDGVSPPCEAGAGCLIPPLMDYGARILEIRRLLVSLQPLGIGGEILRMYEVTKHDLQMLAVIEEELKKFAGDKDDNT